MRDLSLQKISANRKNAQLSTGLKTVLGKAKSALNAVKHGMFKNISDEEARDYETLKLGIFERFFVKNPSNSLKTFYNFATMLQNE